MQLQHAAVVPNSVECKATFYKRTRQCLISRRRRTGRAAVQGPSGVKLNRALVVHVCRQADAGWGSGVFSCSAGADAAGEGLIAHTTDAIGQRIVARLQPGQVSLCVCVWLADRLGTEGDLHGCRISRAQRAPAPSHEFRREASRTGPTSDHLDIGAQAAGAHTLGWTGGRAALRRRRAGASWWQGADSWRHSWLTHCTSAHPAHGAVHVACKSTCARRSARIQSRSRR